MFDSLKKLYEKALTGKKETFGNDFSIAKIAFLLAVVTIVFIQLFVGKYLWNNYLTKLVPVVAPAGSVIDILAVSVLFRLMFN